MNWNAWKGIRRMNKRDLSLSKVYGLLEPGPVVLVTTSRDGRPNIMAMSWHTMLEFEPPLIGCVISDANYSFGLLEANGECGINITISGIAVWVLSVAEVYRILKHLSDPEERDKSTVAMP